MVKKDNSGFTPLENLDNAPARNLHHINSVRNIEKKSCFLTGFTLIELLIVVAIIAILAAIAIPNFLAAQTRSKVARVKGNMKTCATAIEAYSVDNNVYPAAHLGGAGAFTWAVPIKITTPIAYITKVPDDIFDYYAGLGAGFIPLKYRASGGMGEAASNEWAAPSIRNYNVRLYMENPSDPGNRTADIYSDTNSRDVRNVRYALFSMGPGVSRHRAITGSGFWNDGVSETLSETHYPGPYRLWYDPTNGTISIGHVVRLSSGPVSP
jgi:prepilin-type N-terminal cleavage/methylation domain-containing protein